VVGERDILGRERVKESYFLSERKDTLSLYLKSEHLSRVSARKWWGIGANLSDTGA
jgi:hypothetical protein